MRPLPKFWNLNRVARRKTPRPAGNRLRLEALEDRTLPDASALGTLAGVVFIDRNNDGVFRPDATVLPGVIVNLTGTTARGTPVTTAVTADANGAYSFTSLEPGTYRLSTDPVANLMGGGARFSPPGSAGGDLVSGIQIGAGQTFDQNLGFLGLAPGSISLRLFLATTRSSDFPELGQTPGTGMTIVNSPPVVSSAISDVSVNVNGGPTSIDLAGHFADPDIADTTVTFHITDGTQNLALHVELFDQRAPQTVANFLDYVTSGAYNNSFFTRLEPTFVLQGGGAHLQSSASGSVITPVTALPAVPSEFSTSNTQGTLAMALSAGNPNSGTDQYFFNLVDNSSNLDPQRFTVFGKLASAADQQTLNTLIATPTPTVNTSSLASTLPSVDFSHVPLNNYTGTNFPADATAGNFLLINNISVDRRNDFLTYSVVSNSNPGLVTPTLSNERLSLAYTAGMTGTATITVRATNTIGATVDDTFNVTVNPQPPVVDSVTVGADSATSTQVLTATAVAHDPQGLAFTSNYQWLHNGAPISGATTQSLDLSTVSNVNVGDTFAVQVIPNDGTLVGTAVTSSPVTVAGTSPITLTPPVVGSVTITPTSPAATATLTANPTSSSPATFTYQWFRNGAAVNGATSKTLNLSAAGVTVATGDSITVQVTPSLGAVVGAALISSPVTIS